MSCLLHYILCNNLCCWNTCVLPIWPKYPSCLALVLAKKLLPHCIQSNLMCVSFLYHNCGTSIWISTLWFILDWALYKYYVEGMYVFICTLCPEKTTPNCFSCNIFYKTWVMLVKFCTLVPVEADCSTTLVAKIGSVQIQVTHRHYR